MYKRILVAIGLILGGSHRPARKDDLLGTHAGRWVRDANCSVLVARDVP